MATFNMKTKQPEFTPKVRTFVGVADEVFLQFNTPIKGQAAPHYIYDGKLTPFVTITTPKGELALTPGEVADLRRILDAYERGEVPCGSSRMATLDRKLTRLPCDLSRTNGPHTNED